jgi:hypothetical protein
VFNHDIQQVYKDSSFSKMRTKLEVLVDCHDAFLSRSRRQRVSCSSYVSSEPGSSQLPLLSSAMKKSGEEVKRERM